MGVLVLDDRDAAVVYSTGWGQAGSGNEFNSTTTHTNTVGANAKVTFYGTKITVYGTIGGSLTRKPTSSYAIDSGAATNFEGDPGLTAKFNQVFFDSPVLPVGEHTLTITNTGADERLFLDMFMVTPPDTPLITTVTTTATPAVVTSARTVTMTMTMSASATGSTSGTAAGSSDGSGSGAAQKSSNTAAIAGGIIGGLALLVLLIGGFMFYRKRKRQMESSDTTAYNWNTKGADSPPAPLAPQFQAAGWGQPQMAQNTGGSYTPYGAERPQYTNSMYSASGYSGRPANQYAPPSTYTQQVPSTYTPQGAPPLPPKQPSSDLAYYNSNDVGDPYGGYAEQQQGPYPPMNQNVNPSTGRVRVNLD